MHKRIPPERPVIALALAAARQRLLPLTRRAARGERFVLTEHGRPVALLAATGRGPDPVAAGQIGAVILAASGGRARSPLPHLAAALAQISRRLLAAGVTIQAAVVDVATVDRLAARLARPLALIPTANTNRGFTSSLKRGLRFLDRQADAVFIVFASRPAVQSATYRAMARAWRRQQSGALLCQPVQRKRRGHPLLISRTLFPHVLAADPRRGLTRLVHQHRQHTLAVSVTDPAVLC